MEDILRDALTPSILRRAAKINRTVALWGCEVPAVRHWKKTNLMETKTELKNVLKILINV